MCVVRSFVVCCSVFIVLFCPVCFCICVWIVCMFVCVSFSCVSIVIYVCMSFVFACLLSGLDVFFCVLFFMCYLHMSVVRFFL